MDDEKYKRKLETVAKNYAQQDCDVNMLKRLAENIYISGFKRGVEKEKSAKSKTVTNSHDFNQWGGGDYITSHTTEKNTDENASNKVVNYKPGDKFILELGQERKMFGEFEIAGTDLYVKTDLLEKLRRFDLDYTGEWIFHQDWKDDEESPYECNWCGRTFDYDMNYCGYCGAYMKRKAK